MPKTLEDLRDLTSPQRATLTAVAGEPALYETFYLTGGTLLKALGIVPRESNDLDFFTFADIDSLTYTQRLVSFRRLLENLFGPAELAETDRGFRHTASNMLIDIVADEIPNIDEFVSFGQLKTASLKDLAASKASALCSRDETKDYIDIAFLTKHEGWLLADLEKLAESKFKLGTITEEKLLTEILAKREAFALTPTLFLHDGEKNVQFVDQQINYLIDQTSL